MMEVEQCTSTPLVFITTGGLAEECKRYHRRLAELLAIKKGENYASTVSWLREKLPFAILRSALPSLRGSLGRRRNVDLSAFRTQQVQMRIKSSVGASVQSLSSNFLKDRLFFKNWALKNCS